MTTVVHLDSPSEWDRRLPWALRVAAAGDDEIVITVPGAQETRALALQQSKGGAGLRVVGVLEALFGEGGWRAAPTS